MALGPFYVAEQLKAAAKLRGIVILMRHGETDWNRQGRVMGRNPVELNAAGRAQVEAAIAFARELKPDLIVTSPLIRARQSAEILAAGLGHIDVIDEPQVAEVLYGRWEGLTFKELIGDPEYIEYRKAPLTHAPPGGETIVQVQERGVGAIKRLIESHQGKRLLIVSHGDIIRTVLCHFIGADLAHFRRLRVDNAAFHGLAISGDFAEVKFLNLMPDPARAFVSLF